jgi:siderophore synthetase component
MTACTDPVDAETLVTGPVYRQAQRRVLRQLVESMVFEGLLQPTTSGIEEVVITIPGHDLDGRQIAYRCRGHRRAFGRIRLQDRILRTGPDGEHEAPSPTAFLLETRAAHGADDDALARFVHELEQTALKEAQSRLHAAGATPPLRDRGYDGVESGLLDGHPYHPAFKSRVGFGLADNAAFGPEFAPELRPVWVALDRSRACTAASPTLDDGWLRREMGEPTWAAWSRRVPRLEERLLLPVHPWQWREQVLPLLAEELRDGTIVPLGPAPDRYRPQQSIRTLANLDRPSAPSLKLSLSIVNTSTARILAPHTVLNAPAVSDWLESVRVGDPFLAGSRTVVLREVLGTAWNHPQPDPLHARTYGILSCIWRESVHAHLDPGESALPWPALTHLDRDGRPVIAEWIAGARIEPFLDRLLEAVVPPLVHLLAVHGIALEAHAQNLVLLHRHGVPTRVALKDFHDGVRYSPAHLADPAGAPVLHPTPARHVRVNRNSFVTTDRPEHVRDFLLDAFLFVNLGELAIFLAEHARYDETRFWRRVRRLVDDHLARFPARHPLLDPRASSIQIETLTNRRLAAERGVQVREAPNPIGESSEP